MWKGALLFLKATRAWVYSCCTKHKSNDFVDSTLYLLWLHVWCSGDTDNILKTPTLYEKKKYKIKTPSNVFPIYSTHVTDQTLDLYYYNYYYHKLQHIFLSSCIQNIKSLCAITWRRNHSSEDGETTLAATMIDGWGKKSFYFLYFIHPPKSSLVWKMRCMFVPPLAESRTVK